MEPKTQQDISDEDVLIKFLVPLLFVCSHSNTSFKLVAMIGEDQVTSGVSLSIFHAFFSLISVSQSLVYFCHRHHINVSLYRQRISKNRTKQESA